MAASDPITRSDFYVYALFRDATAAPFYVGKGRGRRWEWHEWTANSGPRSHKAAIIRDMLARGVRPIKIKIHEGLTEVVAHEYEIALIAAIGRHPDGPLTNLTDGGEGATGFRHTPESLASMSVANRGQKRSAETCANLSKAMLGKKPSAATREKLSAARRGQKHPPDYGARMSALLRGKKRSPESRARMSEAQRARKFRHSDESRAKMSAARSGKKQSPEQIEKRTAKLRGRAHSPQARANMSAAHLGKKQSPEAVAKRAAAQRGRKASPEARAKISAGLRAAHARRRAKALLRTAQTITDCAARFPTPKQRRAGPCPR